ncbi:MAG: DUF2905 domain-containing protein [Chloroflexota bacterium]|nr:DUF2905 domain-containing protein [Chloroflexota bacterium]
MELAPIGRLLLVVGILIAAVGLLLTLGDRVPLLGRLPGDFTLRGDRWTVHAPLATSLLVSIGLTLGLSLFAWLSRR